MNSGFNGQKKISLEICVSKTLNVKGLDLNFLSLEKIAQVNKASTTINKCYIEFIPHVKKINFLRVYFGGQAGVHPQKAPRVCQTGDTKRLPKSFFISKKIQTLAVLGLTPFDHLGLIYDRKQHYTK